ncbi:MAG TPA: hypothetical protein VHB53_01475 [Solirubrobacterales bacterium]|nr:hypothetical protein [Solirubrobacterales bacterium]
MQPQLVQARTEGAAALGGSGSISLRPAPSKRRREAIRPCLALLAAMAIAVLAILGAARPGPDAPAVVGRSRVVAHRGDDLEALPLAARGPISDFLGSSDPRFAVAGLRAANPDQGLGLRFDRFGATVFAAGTPVGLGLAAYGRGGTMRTVGAGSPRAARNAVVFRRAGLTETYANGPLGLEQSFELAARPVGHGPLTFLTRVSPGASPRADHGSILLGFGAGELRYDDLVVTDADGRRLPANLSIHDGAIAVTVDDAGAAYPLHVDPLVQKAALLKPGEQDTGFGFSVAMEGSTIAVGDPYLDEYHGAVYVFEEPAGGWADSDTPAASLVGDQTGVGVDGENFGASVALSGTTLVVGAPSHKVGDYYYGAAYVFRAPAVDEWEATTRLARLEGEHENAIFGEHVAVAGDGTSVAVAAPGHDANLGGVFVYREGGGWANTSSYGALLHGPPANEGHECPQVGDGLALAEHESRLTVAAGAPGVYEAGEAPCETELAGHTYVFTSPSGGWTGGGEYAPTVTLSSGHGALGDRFGGSMSISTNGEEILTGAPSQTVAGHPQAGAAYVFTRPGSGWTGSPTPATLTSPAPFAEANFGESVVLSAGGSSLAVSQPAARYDANHHTAGEFRPGADFIYRRPGTGWASTDAPDEEVTGNEQEDLNLTGRALGLEGETFVDGGSYDVASGGTAVLVYGPGLGIEIESPVDGAEYSPGQSLTASYRCLAPEGATITRCEGPVAPGSRIDTSSEGGYEFTVNAEDSLGDKTSRSVHYLVVRPASNHSGEPTSKEAAQVTTTAARKLEEEEAHAARLKQEFKEFLAYVEYIFSHPAPIASILKNGVVASRSAVPEPAWIATSGKALSWGLPKASAAAQELATASGAKTGKKPIKVFSKVIHFKKAGKAKVVVPLTAAGRRLAERAIAEHHRLKVDWTITVHPAKGPAQTRRFTAVYKAGGPKR